MNVVTSAIGGKRTPIGGTDRAPIFNPATGQVSGELQFAQDSEVIAAIEIARQAQLSWGATSSAKRARVLFKFLALLNANLDRLARAISLENGKTHDDALGECARALEVVEFACGIPNLLKGDFSANVAGGIDTYDVRQPLGVVVGITPFNFPLMVPMWMFPLAIACGNSFILKPAGRVPSAAMIAWELFQEAGLPDGVFNIVHGDRKMVQILLEHPDVKAVSFVGSTPVAQHVYTTGSRLGKRVQALGGAKNHMVILPDADLDQAADALMGAAYGSAGERCMAIAVAVPVGQQTADRLIERLKPMVERLKVGPSTDTQSEMGPLISKEARDRVAQYIDAGVREGADLVVDGRQLRLQGYEEGYFLGGSLFDRVTSEMSIYRDEIFGPVLSVARTETTEEAMQLIRGHHFANGVAIFTKDGGAARKFAEEVEVGMVGINVPLPVPVGYHSFGGWKQSSFGDHAIYGPEGVRFYTRLKTTTVRWPKPAVSTGAQFTFPSMG